MTYELATQLKDAGFPIHKGVCKDCSARGDGLEICIPTLSELIEACGMDFAKLQLGISKTIWRADAYPYKDVCGDGSSPEEAVARLWLTLHKKETPA